MLGRVKVKGHTRSINLIFHNQITELNKQRAFFRKEERTYCFFKWLVLQIHFLII